MKFIYYSVLVFLLIKLKFNKFVLNKFAKISAFGGIWT